MHECTITVDLRTSGLIRFEGGAQEMLREEARMFGSALLFMLGVSLSMHFMSCASHLAHTCACCDRHASSVCPGIVGTGVDALGPFNTATR